VRWLLAIAIVVLVAVLTGSLVDGESSSQPPPRAAKRKPAAHKTIRQKHRAARPPQFIVVSFDGAGGARLWTYWRGVAKRARAHFTFFVSGVYFLDWAHHDKYAPPGRARGDSSIGFAPDAAWIAAMRSQIALGYRDGHEIGTHYNGHFCGSGGVETWSADDWSHELDEFDRLVFGQGPKLPFGARDVVGGRTPCLEGNLGALYPVLAKRGFRYVASRTAPLGAWPSRKLGLWSVPLLELPFVGHTFEVVSMDYNFLANQIGQSPASIENETYRTLWNGFQATYFGNRAPLSLGIHFETWKSWAYDHAVTRFLQRACLLPEVRCTTMRTLVDWLDKLPPRKLRRFRAGRFPHTRTVDMR
jgi:hypothetical protein